MRITAESEKTLADVHDLLTNPEFSDPAALIPMAVLGGPARSAAALMSRRRRDPRRDHGERARPL